MTWLRRKTAPIPVPDEMISEATRARIQAERDLLEARVELEASQRQTPVYEALAARLKRYRDSNHLGESFRRSFRGT